MDGVGNLHLGWDEQNRLLLLFLQTDVGIVRFVFTEEQARALIDMMTRMLSAIATDEPSLSEEENAQVKGLLEDM